MAEKDMATKKLEDYADVFCDILNVLLFHKKYLKPECIRNGPTESIYKADAKEWNEQRRDTLKEVLNGQRFHIASFGLENQSKIEKAIPIRIMNYDSASYHEQLNQKVPLKELRPVITVVLNFSDHRWCKERSLHEILNIPEELKPFVADYKIIVFDVAFLNDATIEAFTSDFKSIAKFFKQRRVKGDEFVWDPDEIVHVQEVLDLLSLFSNDERYRKIGPKLVMKQKQGRRITMCDVAQKLEDKGVKNGRIRMLADFLSSGGSEADAKRMLKVTEEEIAQAKDILCEK